MTTLEFAFSKVGIKAVRVRWPRKRFNRSNGERMIVEVNKDGHRVKISTGRRVK